MFQCSERNLPIFYLKAIVLGFVTIGLDFLAPVLGDTVIQIALSVFGMIGGPLCGVVTLALFFPCCNAIVSRSNCFRFWKFHCSLQLLATCDSRRIIEDGLFPSSYFHTHIYIIVAGGIVWIASIYHSVHLDWHWCYPCWITSGNAFIEYRRV